MLANGSEASGLHTRLLVHNGTNTFRYKIATDGGRPTGTESTMCTCTDIHGQPTATRADARKAGRKRNRRRAAVVFSIGALMLGGGVAWAAWTNSGTGAANAKATTATALVVTAGTPASTLYPEPSNGYPNSTVGAIYTTVANPNNYPVTVTTVSVGTVSITPQAGKTCAAGSVVATAASMTLATPISLPANASATAVTIPSAVKMLGTAEDGCQGASFSAPVTLTGASS